MSSSGAGSTPRWSTALTAPDDPEAGPDAPVTARKRRQWMVAAAATIAVVALVLTAAIFYRWGAAGTPVASPPPKPSASSTADPTPAAIYAEVAPSVVTVESLSADGVVSGTGTGVIVNADGTILTALHVVSSAVSIRVIFADGIPSAATVLGANPASDIAALGPATLPSIVVPAVLGRADRLAVGDTVVAIGNPLGLTRTTTTGVVSGLNRVAAAPGGVSLSGLIQFDAAVNPGSSGGPLINGKGETVGIVVALINPTPAGTFIGIGFAVPIAAAVAGGDRAPQQ